MCSARRYRCDANSGLEAKAFISLGRRVETLQLSEHDRAHLGMERNMRWLETLFVIVAIGGCTGAHRDYDNDVDSGMSDAAATTCGPVTCDQAPANACVDQDTLRTYTATCVDNACRYPASDVECGTAGCCGDHCCAIEPSNSDVFGFLAPTGLVVAPPNGTFDTDASCTTTSELGSCAVVPRPGLGEACVCKVDELT